MATGEGDAGAAAGLRRLERWLIDEAAPHLPDVGAVVGGFAERLLEAGVPVARATSHVRTLHPVYRAVMREWLPGEGVRETRPAHGIERTAFYLGSTVQHVFETGEGLERRLTPATDGGPSPLADLRARGFTHYLIVPLRFSTGMVNAASWATAAPEGFTATQLGLLRAALPAFRTVVELKALTRVSAELLAAYVGREPSERILAGTVRRGDTAAIDAAVFLSDLRDSSALAGRLGDEGTIAALNAYFDAVVPAVLDAGGEVLKYLGDGVLAIFRVDGDARDAARRALAAARGAAAALGDAGPFPSAGGPIPLRTGVALHLGRVCYGNVGSRGRLDFTVIGSDVNLASRLEALCARLGEPLLLSGRIAPLLDVPVESLGRFDLKGFAEPCEVFRPTADPA